MWGQVSSLAIRDRTIHHLNLLRSMTRQHFVLANAVLAAPVIHDICQQDGRGCELYTRLLESMHGRHFNGLPIAGPRLGRCYAFCESDCPSERSCHFRAARLAALIRDLALMCSVLPRIQLLRPRRYHQMTELCSAGNIVCAPSPSIVSAWPRTPAYDLQTSHKVAQEISQVRTMAGNRQAAFSRR